MRNFPGGPVTAAAGFAINGHGYICSGEDSIDNDNKFWEYYPAVDTWQHKANFPGTPREAPVSFVHDSFAFVGFGFGPGALDFWRYNAIADSWDSISSLPRGNRLECGVSVIDSFAYIYDGFWDYTIYNDIWRYNMNQDHWDSLGITPGNLRSNSLFWTFDSLIIVGYGEEEDPSGDYLMGSDIYSYDTKHNKWDTLTCINFLDSTADGAGAGCFVLGKTGYFFGGYKTYLSPTYYNNLWSFDASQFFPPDTPNGINEVASVISFTVFPNPANHEQAFSISSSESGSISFYDALGRMIDERKLAHGINQVKLTTDDEVIFYRATLQYGAVENGKVVFLK